MNENSELSISGFRKGDAAAFAALNLRWIEEHFEVEPSDRKMLDDPEGTIIVGGGIIAMAYDGDTAIGTGGALPASHPPDDGRNWWEIIKMATAPQARGKGVGQMVLRHLIVAARDQGADALWLETNDALDAAVRLYEREGFRKLTPAEAWPTPYDRCNLQLVLEF